MLEDFIQSEANLVQLFILVLKHRKTIFKIFYLKGPFFRPLKNVKMQFCDFSKKYNFFFRMLIFCTVVHWLLTLLRIENKNNKKIGKRQLYL